MNARAVNVKRVIAVTAKEVAIEDELVRRVEALGGIAEKVTVLGRRGFFDRLIVLPGRVVFCECKRPRGGVVAEHQKKRARIYRALGMEVALIKNVKDIDRLLATQ